MKRRSWKWGWELIPVLMLMNTGHDLVQRQLLKDMLFFPIVVLIGSPWPLERRRKEHIFITKNVRRNEQGNG